MLVSRLEHQQDTFQVEQNSVFLHAMPAAAKLHQAALPLSSASQAEQELVAYDFANMREEFLLAIKEGQEELSLLFNEINRALPIEQRFTLPETEELDSMSLPELHAVGTQMQALHLFGSILNNVVHADRSAPAEEMREKLLITTKGALEEVTPLLASLNENLGEEEQLVLPESDKIEEMTTAELHVVSSQICVLYLYACILKTLIKSKSITCTARYEDRLLQAEKGLAVKESYKGTATFSFTAELLGGFVGMAGGFLPIAGHTEWGEMLTKQLGNAFSTFKDLDAITAFKKIGEIFSAFSQMQRSTSDIRRHNSEGDRYLDQQLADARRADSDEHTRIMEDNNQNSRTLIQSMYDLLSMINQVIMSLYGAG